MNNNQRLFCHEYVKNGSNGTKAYLSVYKCKSENTARINASRLLTNANVMEYVKELQQKVEDKAILSAQERMEYLTQLIKGEVIETVIRGKDADMFEVEACFNDKIKAIDVLNKMDGQYIDRVELKQVDTTWYLPDK